MNNMESTNAAALDNSACEAGRQEQCSCCSRRCRCFAPLLLLVLVVLGVVGVYWYLFGRVHQLDAYRSAMKAIEANEELQQELGRPIQASGWPPPSARIEQRETEVRWGIEGPKGRAKAHLSARLMAGKWQTVILEVVLPDGKKVSIRYAGDAEAEAPLFEGPRPESRKPKPNVPAPEINLPTPPVDMPGSS